MSAARFSKPNVAQALCRALLQLHDGQTALSPSLLAGAVAPAFPGVPLPALRVVARKVLTLFFEYPSLEEIADAGMDPTDEATAAEFFGLAMCAEADSLRDEMARRDGSNVEANALLQRLAEAKQ